jgi:hypothetical protein
MTLLRRLSAALLALVLLPGLVAAQAVAARVVEDASGAPVAGAFVTLLDDAGHPRIAGLTGADGRVLLQAPAPGSYRIRAERVGYSSPVSAPFTLAAGETREEALKVAPVPIQLEGLVARAGRRCVMRGGDDDDVNAVWEEARKALNAAAWTESLHLIDFQARSFTRELDPGTLRVRREVFHDLAGSGGPAYESVPAEDLAENGYIRPDGDGWIYYAPDAQVLLSDTFLDTHCFRLRRGEHENAGRVGLAFQPVRDGKLPDIQGVLWLDAKSAELRYLEFEYIRLPRRHGRRDAGGRVDFQRLPGGAWIVSHWRIRVQMAASQEDVGLGQAMLLERRAPVREFGGEVTEIVDPSASPTRTARGVVQGRVTAAPGEPLPPGLQVYLAGTAYRTDADSAGAFRINGVPDGQYTATLTDPRIALLGFPAPGAAVEVRAGVAAPLELVYPREEEIFASVCPQDTAVADRTGAIYGTLRGGSSGAPLGNVRLQLAWKEGIRPESRPGSAEAVTDQDGTFRICRLPLDRWLEARALDGEAWQPAGRFRLRTVGLVEQELRTAP